MQVLVNPCQGLRPGADVLQGDYHMLFSVGVGRNAPPWYQPSTLVGEGRLSLHEPISKYIPEFADVKVLAGGTADAPEHTARWQPGKRFLSPNGGMVSTVADYLRFTQMMLNGGELDGKRIVSRKTIELIASVVVENEQSTLLQTATKGYGFALVVEPPRNEWSVVAGTFRARRGRADVGDLLQAAATPRGAFRRPPEGRAHKRPSIRMRGIPPRAPRQRAPLSALDVCRIRPRADAAHRRVTVVLGTVQASQKVPVSLSPLRYRA